MSSTEPITTSVVRRSGAVVLAVSGEVDAATAAILEPAIADVLTDEPPTVVIDLSGVTFLASVGLEILVKAHEKASKTGRFAVVAAAPATRRPIELTSVDSVIAMYSTLDEALGAGR